MKRTKVISFILAILMAFPLIVSCSGDSGDSSLDLSEGLTSDNSEEENSLGDASEAVVDIEESYSAKLKNYISKSEKDGSAADKNVIMVQMNSFLDGLVDLTSNGDAITPSFNQLKTDGIYFTEFFAQAENTSDSQYSVLNSNYAPLDGILSGEYLNGNFVAMPSVFAQNGYKSVAFVSENENSYNDAVALKKYGFTSVTASGKNDKEVYASAVAAMKASKDKGFYFISGTDSVYPYLNETSEEPIFQADLLTAYINALHKADEALGLFVSALKDEGLYDDSLIIVYGTAPMLDVSGDEINSRLERLLPDDLVMASLNNAPMVILGAGEGEYTDIATVYDIYPTVMSLCSVKPQNFLIVGENLMAADDRSDKAFGVQGTYSRGTYVTKKVIYIRYSKTSMFYHRPKG